MWRLLSLMLLAVTSVYIQVWAASEEADDDLVSLVKNYWGVGVSNERDVSLDRGGHGKLPKKLSVEILAEMEANAQKSNCSRGCLIGLSKIKCTPKMKKFLPGRCHEYSGDPKTGQGPLTAAAVIPGYSDLTAMEQFKLQVDKCDCSTQCLKGLANVKCSAALKAVLPTRCSQFATQIQAEVGTIKGKGKKPTPPIG
uniref:Secreted luciferase n=1 Tax=Heterorhabdus tanneri TaxID=507446 RepID=H3JS17_9MAXI|nr:secreted luciferase [Heterorhabdus tanneri]